MASSVSSTNDDFNKEALNRHEATLAKFYGRFPWPRKPKYFERLEDKTFYSKFLCQDLGDYSLSRLPRNCSIWVAGCGTNQALKTALRFPEANVVGTDASAASLELCQAHADELQIRNLTLRQEGITSSASVEVYDYILCTGVIHHNPDPITCLRKLATALRPGGVIELMVYNKFHRRETTAFQEALGILGVHEPWLDEELRVAQKLAASIPVENSIRTLLDKEVGESSWADAWTHPYEKSFTVSDLKHMTDRVGLRLEAPCGNHYDHHYHWHFDRPYHWDWELDFKDDVLRERYKKLADFERWHLANLLLLEHSPQLWFYLSREPDQSQSSGPTEEDRNNAFLNTVFRRHTTRSRAWFINESGRYEPDEQTRTFPVGPVPHEVSAIALEADGKRAMSQIFSDLDLNTRSYLVHRARVLITTTQFPYLVAVND